MAVGADGAAFVARRQDLAVNALLVNLFNPDVALAAGGGDIGFVDRGAAIHAALDVMGTVAVIAGRRDAGLDGGNTS